QGLKAEKQESGTIEFTDAKTGKFLFYIQRPFMYDSSKEGNVSEQVTQEITPVDDGFILTVTADESYLTDPKRVYPVVIDPWIDVFQAQDTFVASGTSSNYGNLNYLSVGKDPTLGKTRTYLKWTLPPIPNAKVTGASVGVYQYVPNSSTPAGPSISLHQVTSAFNASIINWSTQPSFDPTPVSTKSETKAGYNYFAVSDLVKGWYDGTVPNYGVVLKTDDAQEATAAQKLFYSTEWNSADGSPYGKPKLVISYRSKKLLGITDYWTYTPDLFNGEGTAVVNVINGNMVYDIPVLSLPGRTDAFNLKMVYNSRSDFEDVYGYRWTFSAQRKLIPNSDKTIVEYIDENGTHYHFNKQQYDTGTAYSAPEGTFFEFNSTPDGGYTLKEPDETVYYFDSQGRNTKVVDEKGNTILYTFNGTTNQITKISERYGSETTGRDLSLAYDPTTGLLQKITDFRGTETTFTYDSLNGHNRLRTITYAANRPEHKTITFDYNDQQQLIAITDGNGNKGKFEYDDLNRVSKIIDPRSDTIFAQLMYPSVNETIFTDANGDQTYYKSNIDQDLATVNVVEIIEDYQEEHPSVTQYVWENNRIKTVIEPNKDTGEANGPTTSAEYDSKGNLKNLVSPDNEREDNFYDDKSNLTSSTTSSGLSEQNVYDSVSNLLFSTNHVGLTDYFTYDRYGNAVTEVTPTSTLYNPVVNANFESVGTNNLPTDWLVRTGSGYAVSSDHVFGTRSAKITLTGTEGSRYYYQDVPINITLADKTYTVAGYMKTTNVTGTGARIRVYFKDVNNQYIKDQAGNTIVYGSPYVTGTRDWMPISYSFTAPSNTAYIHIECIFTGAGTAYFDGIQLDQGAMVTEYASNENVSMEAGSGTTIDNWTLNAFGTGDGRTTEQAKAGQYSVKINGVSSASRYVGQLVSVSGKKDDPLTLSGWAYVKNPNTSGEFSLQLSFVYTDGTTGTFTIPFDKTLTDQWQFVKKTFRAAKDFNQAKIYGVYNNQAGTVYFDNIKLEEKASTSTTTYSADGNFVTSETDELNQTTSYGYDANGNQTSVTTPGGRKTTYAYNYLDQLTSVTLVAPAGQPSITTSYTYDAQGNLKTRTDPRNNVTTFDYNAINQVTLEQDPLGKFIKYDYDNNGNLKSVEKGKDTTILSKQEFKYDRKNQLTEKWVNGQKIVSYTYDYAGNVTSIQANGQTYSYTYDTYNRLKTSQEPDGYQLQNNYVTDPNSKSNDLRSSYVETIGGNSYTTTFGYDTLQRLSSIQVPTGQTTEFYYDESGQPIRMNVKNSANTSSFSVYQSYDDAGRLTGQHVVGADALDLTYAYDADGNIVNYFDGTNPHTFTYDFAGRLQSWTYQGNTVPYDYDAAGNLKNPHGKTLTFNAANEVEGFHYDEAGNLLQDDKYQYEWDGEGRLLTVKDLNGNTIASFTYHPDGLRKTKTVNDVTYHYHYDGSNLIRITDDNGQTVWAFTWNDGEPVSLTNRNGETFFYITNHRGDVVRIVDENGTPVASYSYDPWGKPLSPEPTDARIAGQPIRYAGYVYDVETQLYYLQARYYDPETARFLSRDPVIGTEDLPLTQNPYIYAVDNPVMMTDPDGQHPLVVAVIVVGGRQVVIYYAKKQIKKKAYKLVRKQVKKKVKGTGKVKLLPSSKVHDAIGKLNSNQIKHIINGSKKSNHQWEKLVPDKNWGKIKEIIIDVMHNGADIPYKSVSSRVKMVNGQLVQVTYKKLPDGTIRISDAWVK
ncbi:DNRLRE domain-containing protein, partial [Anoxybacillus sp. J5B_2022]|uniref:DNRLRE domain-containing protein n=1 Tax=Anoxybacillus sp. J5B_2022 TaxID=3003246 RepID=UPI002285752C